MSDLIKLLENNPIIKDLQTAIDTSRERYASMGPRAIADHLSLMADAIEMIEILVGHVTSLTDERDEARKVWCLCESIDTVVKVGNMWICEKCHKVECIDAHVV